MYAATISGSSYEVHGRWWSALKSIPTRDSSRRIAVLSTYINRNKDPWWSQRNLSNLITFIAKRIPSNPTLLPYWERMPFQNHDDLLKTALTVMNVYSIEYTWCPTVPTVGELCWPARKSISIPLASRRVAASFKPYYLHSNTDPIESNLITLLGTHAISKPWRPLKTALTVMSVYFHRRPFS